MRACVPGDSAGIERVNVSALQACTSGSHMSGRGASMFLSPMRWLGSAHAGTPVKFPFRLCLFLYDAEPLSHLENNPVVCDFLMVTVSLRLSVTCSRAYTHPAPRGSRWL